MFIKISLTLALLATPAFAEEYAQPKNPIDAPELAAPGQYKIGTTVESLTIGGRRTISYRLWYPATVAAGAKPEWYRHPLPAIAGLAKSFDVPGSAVADAPPVTDKHFPLVIISHGFQGWATYMAYLAENLASKGYVVASIEHGDKPVETPAAFPASFGEVVVTRALDQRAVIAKLIEEGKQPNHPAAQAIDAEHIGLIGYSMGGFGALSTAGAAYDSSSPTISKLPFLPRQIAQIKDAATAGKIKALIAIAPWGGAPANRSWTAASLASIKTPVLVIDGDHDDVADYAQGVKWIYDSLTGTNRQLLLYRDARHNIAGNPATEGTAPSFSAFEYTNEPVWRGDRINAINIHFITAFLDVNLKGDASKAAYLNVPTAIAGEGDWPQAPLVQNGGRVAGDGEAKYWRGFQRRWALGLELHQLAAGQVLQTVQ